MLSSTKSIFFFPTPLFFFIISFLVYDHIIINNISSTTINLLDSSSAQFTMIITVINPSEGMGIQYYYSSHPYSHIKYIAQIKKQVSYLIFLHFRKTCPQIRTIRTLGGKQVWSLFMLFWQNKGVCILHYYSTWPKAKWRHTCLMNTLLHQCWQYQYINRGPPP